MRQVFPANDNPIEFEEQIVQSDETGLLRVIPDGDPETILRPQSATGPDETIDRTA